MSICDIIKIHLGRILADMKANFSLFRMKSKTLSELDVGVCGEEESKESLDACIILLPTTTF